MAKPLRQARRTLFTIIDAENKALNEELNVMREEFADVDEKGKKIELARMGDKVQYSVTGDNLAKLNNKFLQHLFTHFTADVLPAQEKDLPQIVKLVEKIDEELELNPLDEGQVTLLLDILSGKVDLAKQAEEAKAAAEKEADGVQENKAPEAEQSGAAAEPAK